MGKWPVAHGQAFLSRGYSALIFSSSRPPTEMTAQLDGTVATNASGARSYRYGPTRNHIVFFTIVLASSETLSMHRGQYTMDSTGIDMQTDQGTAIHIPPLSYTSPVVKNASGYFSCEGMDCIDLFIGSEGTLGFFLKVGIRLAPSPVFTAGLSFFPTRDDAFDYADLLRRQSAVSAIEYFDATENFLLSYLYYI